MQKVAFGFKRTAIGFMVIGSLLATVVGLTYLLSPSTLVRNAGTSLPIPPHRLAAEAGQVQEGDEAVERALNHVRRDAHYVVENLDWDPRIDKKILREFTMALAAMNYVQSRVSPTQYGYFVNTKGSPLPNTDPLVLLNEAGICGNQVSTFLRLITSLGLRARSIEFYWLDKNRRPSSHIGAEVLIGARWAYFDITWGTYFKGRPHARGHLQFPDILTLGEVQSLQNPMSHAVTNAANLAFRLQVENRLKPFSYLRLAHSVLVGKSGTVQLMPMPTLGRNGEAQEIRPVGVPNYIGVVEDYSTGQFGRTKVSLRLINRMSNVIIQISAVACTNDSEVVLTRGLTRTSVKLNETREKLVRVPLPRGPGSRLVLDFAPEITGTSCVIVFNAITLQ